MTRKRTPVSKKRVSTGGAKAAALRERDNLIAAVTEHLPGVVGSVDLDLRYRFASRGYERIFGISPDAMLGRTIREIVGEHAYQRVGPYAKRSLAGEPVTFENLVTTPSGEESVGLVTFVPDINACSPGTRTCGTCPPVLS